MAGDKENLKKVQRRAISMMSGLRSQQYEVKLRKLELSTLEERRHQLDMTQTFKIFKGMDNGNKSIWFTPASEGQVRVTRMAANPLNVRQRASRLDIGKQFYSQRVVDGWNKVPTDIKKQCDSEQFQDGLQKTQRGIEHRGELEAATLRVKIGKRTTWMSSWSQQQSLRCPSGTNETQTTKYPSK
jgi:hypothetical protein